MKKKLSILLTLVIIFAAAFSTGCNNKGNEKPPDIEETVDESRFVLRDFNRYDPDFMMLFPSESFGIIDVNTDSDFVKSGTQSAKLRPFGNYQHSGAEVYVDVPLISPRFQYDYGYLHLYEYVELNIYNAQTTSVRAYLQFISDDFIMKRKEYTLVSGWNCLKLFTEPSYLGLKENWLDVKVKAVRLSFDNFAFINKTHDISLSPVYYWDDAILYMSNKKTKPVVQFFDAGNKNESGVEYILPSVSAFSPFNIEEELLPEYKLIYTGGGTEEDVTGLIEDGSFTPVKSGGYEYRITASDDRGNETEAKFDFRIRAIPFVTDEVESFNDPASAVNARQHPKADDFMFDSIAHNAAEIDGITNSLKLTITKKWPHLYIRPRQATSAYSQYASVSFKLFIPSAGAPTGVTQRRLILNGEQHFNVPLDAWTTVTVSRQFFLENNILRPDYGMQQDGYACLFYFVNDGIDSNSRAVWLGFTAYVADIKGV